MQRANWVADVSHVKACVTDALQSLPACFVRWCLKSVPPQARYHNPAGRPSGSSYQTNTASSVPNAPTWSDPASSVRKTRTGGETVPHPFPLPEHTGSVRSPCCRNRQRKYPKWQRLCKRSDRRRRDNPGRSSCPRCGTDTLCRHPEAAPAAGLHICRFFHLHTHRMYTESA